MRQLPGTLLTIALLVLASCDVTTARTEFARGEIGGDTWVATAHLQRDAVCMSVRLEAADGQGGSCSTAIGGFGVSATDDPFEHGFVYGVVPARATQMVVELADGRVVRDATYAPPHRLSDDLRLFVIPVEGAVDVKRYEAIEADGTVVASYP